VPSCLCTCRYADVCPESDVNDVRVSAVCPASSCLPVGTGMRSHVRPSGNTPRLCCLCLGIATARTNPLDRDAVAALQFSCNQFGPSFDERYSSLAYPHTTGLLEFVQCVTANEDTWLPPALPTRKAAATIPSLWLPMPYPSIPLIHGPGPSRFTSALGLLQSSGCGNRECIMNHLMR
jgi:hypothetical protein